MTHTFYYRKNKKGLSSRAKRRRYQAQNSNDLASVERGVRHWKYIKGAYEDLLKKDARGAEKKLLKLLKKDPKNVYALSKLISVYNSWSELTGGPARLEDAEKLCDKAVRLGIDNTAVASSVISIYGKIDRMDKAWNVFNAAVDGKYADSATYNSMMAVCSSRNDVENAKNVFNMARKNSIEHIYIYSTMILIYFNTRRYTDVIKTTEDAPKVIRDMPSIQMDLFESYRKLKRYERAIKEIDEFLSIYENKSFDDDFYVHARTIRAYCLMHSGRELDALGEFAVLKLNIDKTNVHYPRILCGFIFSKPVLNEVEREHLLADLDFFGLATGKSMEGKIQNAMKMIEKEHAESG